MGMSGTSLHWGEPFLEPLRERLRGDRLRPPRRRREQSSGGADHDRADGRGRRRAAARAGARLAHVLGISMGGMVAQELVLAEPELVRTLTLGCTYCGGPRQLTRRAAARAAGRGDASGDRERALRAAWEVNVSPARGRRPARLCARFHDDRRRRAVALPVIMAQMRRSLGTTPTRACPARAARRS